MSDVAITLIKDQIEELSREGKAIVIADNQSYEVAGLFLKRIKQAQKDLDDRRRSMTRPLDESKKQIMDLFRPVESKIIEIETSIKKSLVQYQAIVDARIKAELEEKRKKDEAEAAEKAKDAEFFGEDIFIEETKVEDQMQNVAPVVSGISTKTVWDYEIIDMSKLPIEMMMPDPKKIRAAVDFGMRDVPGLRIFSKQVVSARR
jgi:hypothetical protein